MAGKGVRSEFRPLGEVAPPRTASAAEIAATLRRRGISPDILDRRICDLGLRIEGGPLEPVVRRFREELRARGIDRVRPGLHLSNEWGVPDGTVAIGIPFYLADERLRRVQEVLGGMVEGTDDEDVLRYLRHEMGHVVNYAYRLYRREVWRRLFGSINRRYREEYWPVPFSLDFVRHLPGSYAQKHPDEDWAETFAVWMAPGLAWRERYGDSPRALAKLEYCDRTIAALRAREPRVTRDVIDVDLGALTMTVRQFYVRSGGGAPAVPRSLDGDLAGIFAAPAGIPAGRLLRREAPSLAVAVYRWTGVDPDRVQGLALRLAERAEALHLWYRRAGRDRALVEVAGLLTTVAMNYLQRRRMFHTRAR